MMTPEQRELAEQIADYVRREVREVGLRVDSAGLRCILTGYSIHDGKPVWRDLWDPELAPIAQEVVERGIPDLSDYATIDALLRHLRRRGWVALQRAERWGAKCRIGRSMSEIAGLRYEDAWLAVARTINKETNNEP